MESVTTALNATAAVVLLLSSLAAIAQPTKTAKAMHFQLLGNRGRAEFRTAVGAVFIPPAVVALVSFEPLGFRMIAAIWLGAAAMRIVALATDRPEVDKGYVAFFLFEAVMGCFALV
ncbi:hypothetical protein ACWFQ8_33150 [Streptomyces sp. NPDC055254]